MKTYVLMVSRVFPQTHKRKGEPTGFEDKIMCGDKKHTIRGNYDLWKKRIDEVRNGDAMISVRCWSGKPYNSQQCVIIALDNTFDVGIQQLYFKENKLLGEIAISPDKDVFHSYTIADIAKNDGLEFQDFKEWFRKYDLSKPMAIIHFTEFRY